MELVKPSIEYKDSFIEGVKEFQAEGRELNINVAELINNFEKFIKTLKDAEKGVGLPEGYISHTKLWLVDKGEFIGSVDIRHKLTEKLLQEGGNIGYSIRPSKRGQGYGNQALALALPFTRELGINRVLLTCDEDNIASAKIIEKNGGVLENKITLAGSLKRRYWIENNL